MKAWKVAIIQSQYTPYGDVREQRQLSEIIVLSEEIPTKGECLSVMHHARLIPDWDFVSINPEWFPIYELEQYVL